MTQLLAKQTPKGRGELYIYSSIGEDFFGNGVSANSVKDALGELKGCKALDVFINSPGGVVFDGVTIFNQIKRFDVAERVTHIDGLAASIASVIALASDRVEIADNAMMMIHDPFGFAIGNAEELRKTADTMDQVGGTIVDTYVAKTKQSEKQIRDWMAAETWMNATECVERGFADKIVTGAAIAASVNLGAMPLLAKFRNVPERLKKPARAPHAMLASMSMDVRRLAPNSGGGPRAA